MAWLADVRSIEREAPAPVRHYRVVTRAKRGGGVRVLEVPKPRLREAQRRLLHHVVAPIPVHAAGHGGVRGRSVATALAPHAGHGQILRMDLASFFGSVGAGRIWGVLRTAGYPEAVAHAVSGLTTTAIARAAWATVPVPAATDPVGAERRTAHRRLGRELSRPHLPQGAPTSPGLANLVAYSLDVRLSGLAASLGCAYSRYVDDLLFSAPNLPSALLRRRVPEIVAEEGFAVAAAKTVLLSRANRQQVLGAVVNERTTVARREYDNLRATMHDCRVHGPASQTGNSSIEAFRERLIGRVAWVNGLDAGRGRRLRAGLESIDWNR
ncbi:MAG: reverse transcriptase family protein [Actinomycetota bacterium]|nr:reverse transcriptase family protein [Actinomycetota bacterium]